MWLCFCLYVRHKASHFEIQKKNQNVTDTQTYPELSNGGKIEYYIVQPFLQMLQKTGPFYLKNASIIAILPQIIRENNA